MPIAEISFKKAPTKKDSVIIGNSVHTFRRTKLRKVLSDIKRTFGKKFGLSASYGRKSRRAILTVTVSQLTPSKTNEV